MNKLKNPLNIVVVTIPLHGHVNPLLGIVKGLVAKGHKVCVYSTEEFKPAIIAAGAAFKYAAVFEFITLFSPDLAKDPLKLTKLVLDLTEKQAENFTELVRAENADILLHDGYCIWAKIAAKVLDIPAVSVITTLVFIPELTKSFPGIAWKEFMHLLAHPGAFLDIVVRYNKLKNRYDIKTKSIFDIFINEEKLNIIFTSRYFQPQSKTIPQSFVFIGPSLSGRNHLEKEKYDFKEKNPLIYISLGTIFNNDPQFYHLCAEAFADSPYNVLISIGKATDVKVFRNLPSNVRIRSHVNQISVLQDAAVFVSHGGMNSVNESMYYAVPMVLFPAVQEQKLNSFRLQQLGAGLLMDRNGLTKEDLFKTVTRVIEDASFKKNALEVQRSLKEAGGIDLAVKKIEELV